MADKKFSDFTAIGTTDDSLRLVGLQGGDNVILYPYHMCFSRKTTLSSAQILALFATPQMLVPAAGSNTMIVPIRFLFRLNYVSAAYTTNTQLVPKTGALGWQVETTILPATSNKMSTMIAGNVTGLSSPFDWINAPLVLTTNTGNPAAGNGTMDIWVTFQVIPL